MRKKIAVFICAISFSNQKRILEGILEEAKKKDLDVFIFTCHMNHSASYMKIKGAFSVMMLPDFKEFDGAILMKNTIRDPEIADALTQKIIESRIPAASIEEDVDGMHSVGISNYHAQKQVVEHFITEHGCKRICYVTGLLNNLEGNNRFRAYKDAMSEHGLTVDSEDVFYGNYIISCGADAVRQFTKGSSKPDAIICANDAMAIGVIKSLHSLGYKIPGDILVAGFDNDTFSKYSIPMLTTVDQNQEEIGKRAVRLLEEACTDKHARVHVEPKLIIGESCGCIRHAKFPVEELRDSYGNQIGIISQAVDTMKNMSIELAGQESMGELFEHLQKYIAASDADAFFLCMEDESEEMEIPLAYINKEFTKIGAYKKGMVLPDCVRDTKEPAFYIATSLFYGDMNFGYIIQRGSRFAIESELAYSWVVNVGIAIENIRKIDLMQKMLDRLNTMWMYDTLTNIYNRGGFYHFSNPMLERLKEQSGKCYLIFFDLDGLKAINDNQGHEMGDKCICSMAQVLKKAVRGMKDSTPICMRYGGDEFVVFGECKDQSEPEYFIKRVNEEIKKINQKYKDFVLSCSMGFSIHEANSIYDLNGLIEEADKKMYEEKKAKKKRVGGN